MGHPLVAWSIMHAKLSNEFDRIIVSTDDTEIATIARAYGAEVPFLRPPSSSDDLASTESVIEHLVTWLLKNQITLPDQIVLLQPTSPIRRKALISDSLNEFLETKADALLTVTPSSIFLWTNKDEPVA